MKRRVACCPTYGAGAPCSVGSVPESEARDEVGCPYPAGRVEGRSEGALEILRSPDLREAFGKVGRAVALERFSAERLVPAVDAGYQRALGFHPQTLQSPR